MTCHCEPTSDLTWCPNHRVWKTRHWITLCQTRPAYCAAWEAGKGPGQVKTRTAEPTELPGWLTCHHRGERGKEVQAREFGCGCGTIQFHECLHFSEPIVLKVRNEARRAMIGKVEGYTGRTCATCPIPGGSEVQPSSSLHQTAQAHTAPGSAAATSRSTR